MSKRPPLLGYNHNVRHAGRLFHVQTEDSGLTRLYVTTHLFLDGTILSTARAQYTADEPDEIVQKKMQAQHKTMLKRLRDGDFDNADDPNGRLHPPRLSEASTGELAVPRELPGDPAQDTIRQAAPAGAREATRPPSAAGPILAPVAPPPILPRPAAVTGSLAERLRRPTGSHGSGPPPPPIPGARPAPVPPQPPRLSEPQAVLEFEADLPDDDDDLEPAVTIEVADPAPPEPTTSYGPAAMAKLSAPPLPTTAAGPPASLSKTGVPRSPALANQPIVPVVAPPVPVVAPPVLPMRTGLATTLRARPTAEGVVLQRTLVPTPSLRPGADSVRTTSPRARPTAPAPLAVAQSIHPLDDDRSLDPLVLAYLAREIRPRDA